MTRKKGVQGWTDVRELIAVCDIAIIPFDEEHSARAADAHARYGKRRHPANLNLGDCCAYALAKATGEPLLFKGEDFRNTDAVAVI